MIFGAFSRPFLVYPRVKLGFAYLEALEMGNVTLMDGLLAWIMLRIINLCVIKLADSISVVIVRKFTHVL